MVLGMFFQDIRRYKTLFNVCKCLFIQGRRDARANGVATTGVASLL